MGVAMVLRPPAAGLPSRSNSSMVHDDINTNISQMLMLDEEKKTTSSTAMRSSSEEEEQYQEREEEQLRRKDDQVLTEGMVCVTSGASMVGLAILRCLLARSYTNLRPLLHSPEEVEKLGEVLGSSTAVMDDVDGHKAWEAAVVQLQGASVVVAEMTDEDSLCDAFRGCVAVFHTSSFVDSAGLSGYSKQMAETEARTAERVTEACVRTESVRKCVFTSSLLACIWRGPRRRVDYSGSGSVPDITYSQRPVVVPAANTNNTMVVDEKWWSDEGLCRDEKLWLALGKTMAEKAAWRAAAAAAAAGGGRDDDRLELVTLCPGLVTGPPGSTLINSASSTASIAYLKGGEEMARDGLLATVEVGKLAEAHVRVYEAMHMVGMGCRGRYICFDRVIQVADGQFMERQQLDINIGTGLNINIPMPTGRSSSANNNNNNRPHHHHPQLEFQLSMRKLSGLLMQMQQATSCRRRGRRCSA